MAISAGISMSSACAILQQVARTGVTNKNVLINCQLLSNSHLHQNLSNLTIQTIQDQLWWDTTHRLVSPSFKHFCPKIFHLSILFVDLWHDVINPKWNWYDHRHMIVHSEIKWRECNQSFGELFNPLTQLVVLKNTCFGIEWSCDRQHRYRLIHLI